MGSEVNKDAGVYFLGELRPEDVGILTRKVRRLAVDDLKSAIETVLSEFGKVQTYDDGLVVVADRVEVLDRVAVLFEGIERETSGMWVIQLHVISMSATALHDFGLDVAPALEIAADFASASSGVGAIGEAIAGAIKTFGDDAEAGVEVKAGLDAVLRAVNESEDVYSVAQPMFVLEDGAEGSFTLGDSIPVPKRSTSDAGTVTTEGYEKIQTGLEITAVLREFDRERARLELEFSNSSIIGFVEEAPRTSEEKFQSTVVVESGGVYLLGSLPRERMSAGNSGGFLSVGDRQSGESGTVMIWGRVARIAQRPTAVVYRVGKGEIRSSDIAQND